MAAMAASAAVYQPDSGSRDATTHFTSARSAGCSSAVSLRIMITPCGVMQAGTNLPSAVLSCGQEVSRVSYGAGHLSVLQHGRRLLMCVLEAKGMMQRAAHSNDEVAYEKALQRRAARLCCHAQEIVSDQRACL